MSRLAIPLILVLLSTKTASLSTPLDSAETPKEPHLASQQFPVSEPENEKGSNASMVEASLCPPSLAFCEL